MCVVLSIINNNYIYSLQLHVSTHMSHLQARTTRIFVFAMSLWAHWHCKQI